MPYQIAGIDVHKKMLAVVVADVEVDSEYQFQRRKVGTSPAELRALADWLVECEVEEVRPRRLGDLCGRRWSGPGDRGAGPTRAPLRCRARSISRKHSRIVAPVNERRISPMPSA